MAKNCIFIMLLIGFSALRAFADPSTPSAPLDPGEEQIGVVNLSNEQVNPELRDCLQHELLGACLKKELAQHPFENPPPIASTGQDIQDDNTNLWSNFLFGILSPKSGILNYKGVGLYYGVQIGGKALAMDQVLTDPNKFATEQALGTQDVWVRHDFEIMPGAGYGYGPHGKNGVLNDSYVNGLFTLNNVMRITKRHAMDQVYNDNFWGYTRQDLQVAEQAFPMYLTISNYLNGKGLLPGEGIEFERYGLIGLGLGPTLNLIATPITFTTVRAGIFGSAGLVVKLVRGHFRTTMEVQTDGTLHLTLEKLKQDSEELQGEVDAGLALPVIGSYVLNLIKAEIGVTHTSDKLLDMIIDPKYPQAVKALFHAYLGFFGTAQDLAAQADTNYQGVREIDQEQMTGTTHDRDFNFFFFNRGSNVTQNQITEEPADTSFSTSKTTVNSFDEHRATPWTNRDLTLEIQTDDQNPDSQTNQSLDERFKFQSNNAIPSDIEPFLNAGRVLAPPEQQEEISSWEDLIRSGGKLGRLHSYFYIGLDPLAFSAALKECDPAKSPELITNWAKLMGLSDWQSWGAMSAREQNQAARRIPGLKPHLRALRRFLKALAQALKRPAGVQQAQAFVGALRGKTYDISPIVALAMGSLSNAPGHLLALERLTLGDGAGAKTLQFSSIGARYSFVKQPLY